MLRKKRQLNFAALSRQNELTRDDLSLVRALTRSADGKDFGEGWGLPARQIVERQSAVLRKAVPLQYTRQETLTG